MAFSITIYGRTILSITIHGKITLSITTHGITTLSITIHGIMTLSITILSITTRYIQSTIKDYVHGTIKLNLSHISVEASRRGPPGPGHEPDGGRGSQARPESEERRPDLLWRVPPDLPGVLATYLLYVCNWCSGEIAGNPYRRGRLSTTDLLVLV